MATLKYQVEYQNGVVVTKLQLCTFCRKELGEEHETVYCTCPTLDIQKLFKIFSAS